MLSTLFRMPVTARYYKIPSVLSEHLNSNQHLKGKKKTKNTADIQSSSANLFEDIPLLVENFH